VSLDSADDLIHGFIGLVQPSQHYPRASHGYEPSRTAPSAGKYVLVLFVDNTQTNIDLVRSTLEPSGYQVISARSVQAGLELARKAKPDLIVSDVHMPHQDGYDFIRIAQADPELAGIPFIFLSSSVWSAREKEQALKQGAKKFISRPVEPEVLLSEIDDCLQKES